MGSSTSSRGHLAAHALAIIEANALRAVDEQPQQPAPTRGYILQLDQLVAQLSQ